MRNISHYIDGRIVEGTSGNQSPVFNPASGEQTASVDLANPEEVIAAISAAKAAFPAWSATTALNRARVMFKFKELVQANREKFEAMICGEHGKVLSDAGGELSRGLEVVEFACGIPHLLKGEHSKNVGAGVDSWSEMQPLGVVAGITPFNFPAMVPMWMFPVALCCGNTFILKPSEKDPSAALLIAELLSEAGLPDGVFNVVNGDKVAVDTLLSHDDVEAISFVGSTPIAEYVYSTASKYGKRAQALGGAKNHMMIMQDADLDQAADALMGAAYGSAGERCMAISVAVCVGDDVADQLIAKLKPRVETLVVRPGTDADAEMGPLISSEHLNRVLSYVKQGIDEGATLMVDGRDIAVIDHESGFFVGGCLFDHVKSDMSIYQDEIFGPVLCVVRVPDFESGCELINNHQYGNGTAIFTRDGDCARQFTHSIQVGMVGVNVPIPVPMAFHSFGGWKRSIFGPLNVHGPDGVRFYTRMKTITGRWPTGIRAGTDFSMPLMK
ncbi:MAG: CoA-acylating methylmalonate-semialdehyde dehydrogenase [Gammaproteobacteria bacterium]|jgi:malonate-semialdehyde dehydrogenase (acetylating)/methylmalonate-semialdehyde dehydrogenase|nr:CoA-acylating methylmalonate-semialdehyde dehydrogenase [Gammaproteobacteria bacterium]MBT3858985.1 CoA-acylating methylmalonate-semialdehyde dehydrogenase [Gammaproteobacteria bacterium]MBT3988063.1 CoA-acylating methylmalonate-semialdehyde dehydrogenase [Gammaproteobacteria bacterium]MBT4658791.1 CoA-acylating methylmalonate-semialdehyde dehydrogenase [Gammaproteobacteria bacterium]MBT4891439.1 CoA-acylating methylmalonate-semialdehyde dehydrogenase [Gammaproteobacteria bacterium]